MTAHALAGVPLGGPADRPSALSPSPPASAALCAIARLHQTPADPATLAHQLGLSPTDALQPEDLLRAARHLGLVSPLFFQVVMDKVLVHRGRCY